MNKKQYNVLAWSFLVLGFILIGLDSFFNSCLNILTDVSVYSIHCIISAEILEPFIYISYFLWIVFLIIGKLEKN